MSVTEADCSFDHQLGERFKSAFNSDSSHGLPQPLEYEHDDVEDLSELEDDDDGPFCDEQDLQILSVLTVADLKDFSSSISVNLEESPYVQLRDKDGQPKVVKKSSLTWYLENNVQKLSSDRTLRVRSLNVPSGPSTQVVGMGKQDIVVPGDWCAFRKDSEDGGFLVGRILLFSHLERGQKVFQWERQDSSASDIGALCDWFHLDFNTGRLELAQMKTHGFYPMSYYICSFSSPLFSVSEDGIERNVVPRNVLESLIKLVQ